jgi:hypothetical protein
MTGYQQQIMLAVMGIKCIIPTTELRDLSVLLNIFASSMQQTLKNGGFLIKYWNKFNFERVHPVVFY